LKNTGKWEYTYSSCQSPVTSNLSSCVFPTLHTIQGRYTPLQHCLLDYRVDRALGARWSVEWVREGIAYET